MSSALQAEMDWTAEVVRLIRAEYPVGEYPPMTRQEKDSAYSAYALRLSAREFANMVLDGRKVNA